MKGNNLGRTKIARAVFSAIMLVILLSIMFFSLNYLKGPITTRKKNALEVTGPVLSMIPPMVTGIPGDNFNVDFMVDTKTEKASATDITVTYNPNILRANSLTVGDALPVTLKPGIINNGTITIALGSQPTTPKLGIGKLATVNFTVIGYGSDTISYTSQTQLAVISQTTNFISALSGVTVNIPSPTSTIGPTQSAGNVNLNMKLKFQGINKLPSSGQNSMTVNVKIYKEGEAVSSDGNGIFVADANGVWTGTIKVNIKTLSGKYRILVKGNQHIQKKICDSTPTETSPGIYQCSIGTITLTAGDNQLNLSGIILLTGDLDQSGIVDSIDFGMVRNNLGKKDAATLVKSDINRDGIVDSQDFSLIIAALRIRTDEQ